MSVDVKELTKFLIKAKKETYAGEGKELIVDNTGMKQLDYAEGKWCYRDTYSGSPYFIGQETVSFESKPIWSMIYEGGLVESKRDNKDFVRDAYAFLRKAMSEVTEGKPFRGPDVFEDGKWKFECSFSGNMEKFSGKERILLEGVEVYSLRFSGGYFI